MKSVNQVGLFILMIVLLGFLNWRSDEVKAQSLLERRGILDNWEDRFNIGHPKVGEECVVTGCANELCMPKGTNIDANPCIQKPEHSCFQSAECVKQADGNCGWTQTGELQQCVNQANQPTPTLTLAPSKTPTPSKPAAPSCGNQLCEAGESSYWDCQRGSCVLRLGLCTTDCPPVSSQAPTPTPTPTKKPLAWPTILLRKTPTPKITVSVTPEPQTGNEEGGSWIEDWFGRLGQLFN